MSSLQLRQSVPTRQPAPRSSVVAALDLGSTKVACFLAMSPGKENGPMQVAGVGHQPARGVRNGVVIDRAAATASIIAAVGHAERMAGVAVSELVVSVSGFGLKAARLAGDTHVGPGDITERDARRVIQAALAQRRHDGRQMLHAAPLSYAVDGAPGVRDPRGMVGQRLDVALSAVTAPQTVLRNLSRCVEDAGYLVRAAVAAPYAAALSALVEDERERGAVCIDMGGGLTSAAVFAEGALAHVDSVPLGGAHVTGDIAHGLGASYADAERLKTMFGTVLASPYEDQEHVDVPVIGDDGGQSVTQQPRSLLTGMIRPRVEETLELLRDRLRAAGVDRSAAGRRIVLTGGGAQLTGVRELAARVFETQVRLGRPLHFQGLADAVSGPAFAGVAGLLRWGVDRPVDLTQKALEDARSPAGMMGRAVAWVRDHFWA
jgi:cell division protein FtsA